MKVFYAENFAYCPLTTIESALSFLRKKELTRLDQESMPLGELGNLMVGLAGAAKKGSSVSDSINPYGYILRKTEARRLISQKTAKLILQLNKERQIPAWARTSLDWEMINLSASN